MPQALVNGAVIGVRQYSVLGAQTAIQSYYYQCVSAGINPATDADIAANLDTLAGAGLIPLMNSTAVYRGTTSQWLTPGALRAINIANANSGSGSGGIGELPAQTAGLVTWRTDFARPAFRGRTYFPFPAPGANSSLGVPTSAYITTLNAYAFALLNYTVAGAGGRSSTVKMVLAHRLVALSFSDIIEGVARPGWATIRRRGFFGRPNSSPI